MRKANDPANESPIVGLEQYYEEFRQSRLEDLNLMTNALHSNDFGLISGLAHKWRGYCAPYGFGLLAQMAEDIERASENHDQGLCEQYFSEVLTYLSITKKKGDS